MYPYQPEKKAYCFSQISHDTMTTALHTMNYTLKKYTHDILPKAFLAEKLVLFSTDTVWSIGCLLDAEEARHKLQQLAASSRESIPEILFASVQQLKEYIPGLHPRLETLLHVHQRPLTLQVPAPAAIPASQDDMIAVRVVKDHYCGELLRTLDQPVYSIPAFTAEGTTAGHFGQVSSDILSAVDYVDKFRQTDTSPQTLSVMAKLGPSEELDFIRE